MLTYLKVLVSCVTLFNLLISMAVSATDNLRRVLAEWESQEATWLQWPGRFEKIYEPAFAEFSAIISRYQKLHIVVRSD